MSDNQDPTWSSLGGPNLVEAYERLFLNKADRAFAIGLLETVGVLAGITEAATRLREAGRKDDANHLESATAPFQTWTEADEDHLETLRTEGMKAVRAHANPRFVHRVGDWDIRHLGSGVLLVQAPRKHLCAPPAPPEP